MTTILRIFVFTAVAALAIPLAGCLESTDVKSYQPGVYQGTADPLINGGDAAALEARFRGQMDR